MKLATYRTGLLAAAFTVALAAPARATPVVEFATAQTLNDSRAFTLGFSFTTSVAFTLDGLGYFNDGLGNSHQVGIWTLGGTLLTSTTVLGTDPVTGHFRYHAISFLLAPGSYVIGGQYLGNSDPFPSAATGVTSLPGYTYGEDRQLQGGFAFPTVVSANYGPNGILAVDFSVGQTAAVPEPATLTLLAGGLLGVFGAVRRRRATR